MKKSILMMLAIVGLLMSQVCVAQTTTKKQEEQKTEKHQADGEHKGEHKTEQKGDKTETKAKAPVPTPVPMTMQPAKDKTPAIMVAALTPENTKVDFVGTHVVPKGQTDPNARLGGFSKFEGQIHFDEKGETFKAMVVNFETASVWTQMDNLTKHLTAADFLNVEKFPSASFASTEIKPTKDPAVFDVTGDFTLLGETKPITIPCRIEKSKDGIVVQSNFKLDRGEFGMTEKLDRVSSLVSIKMDVGFATVGDPAKAKTAKAGNANARPGGRQRMAPAERFKMLDKNGDGEIAKDEAPEQMQQFFGRLDADGNDSISLTEWEEAMSRFQGGRGRGNAGGGTQAPSQPSKGGK